MKKILIVLVCLTMLLSLCAPAFAAEKELFRLECEDGEISGAAKDYKDGNIQAVSIASGGFVVGLGGVNDHPQESSTVTWSDVKIPADGEYKLVFGYDTGAGETKKADLLVDGKRYPVEIDMDKVPANYNMEILTYELTVTLTAGRHTFAVTTAEDFNRDAKAGPVVKSVNADYLDVILVKETALTTAAPVTSAPETTAAPAAAPTAPKTADAGILTAAVLVSAAAAAAFRKKK